MSYTALTFDRFDITQIDRDFINCIVAIGLMDAVELSVTLINAHRSAIGQRKFQTESWQARHGKLPLDLYVLIEQCDDIAWAMRNSDQQKRRAWIMLGEFHSVQDAKGVRYMLELMSNCYTEDEIGDACEKMERFRTTRRCY